MCVNFTSDMRVYQLHVRVKENLVSVDKSVLRAKAFDFISIFIRMLRTQAVHSEA